MRMPERLTLVGDLERPDHYHLPADAACLFWGEYTPYEHTGGKKWNYSATNRLMSNFKMRMDRVGQTGWHYKAEAIQTVVRALANMWLWADVMRQHQLAVVPVPPSKARTDPMYDPRMLQVLQGIAQQSGLPLDIRDCLSFSGANVASHVAGSRPTPDQLYQDLTIDPVAANAANQPDVIVILDDMLTTGAHYAAVARKLREHFPNAHMIGMFVARRIVANPFANIAAAFDAL